MHKQVFQLISLPFNVLFIVVYSFHIILLILWLVALYKNLIRLRRKVTTPGIHKYNEERHIDVLNSKVEYRKYLFMFAIVVCELISSLLSVSSSLEILIHVANYLEQPSDFNYNNSAKHTCNKENYIPTEWEFSNHNTIRMLIVSFGIPLILTFSLVCTLMSYYVMVTKKSLNYSASLESVDLAREQKVLLLVSSVVCVILLVLLVRVEVFIIFQIVESIITLFQSYVTCKYSRKLIQVLNWKKLDTRIAFGTDNYQYKLCDKNLKLIKRAIFLYTTAVVAFSTFIIMRTFRSSAYILNPAEFSRLFKYCIRLNEKHVMQLNKFIEILFILENVPVIIYLSSFFFLNIATIPFLLSKINFRCHISCKCLRSSANKNLGEPLLK